MFLEVFDYPFMLRALGASICIGLLCSVLGIFVVLRGMALLSDALAHLSLCGIAVGLLIGVSPQNAAIIFSVLMGLLIVFFRNKLGLEFDTTIGILFSGGLAIGVLMITVLMKQGYRVNLHDLLFGEILGIGPSDLLLVAVATLAIGVAVLFIMRPMVLLTFHESLAQLQGVRLLPMEIAFMVLLSLTVGLSIQIVGVVLVSAMLVIPAATAQGLAGSFRGMVAMTFFLGLITSISGIIGSYYLNTPPGPTLVLAALACFIIGNLTRRFV